MAYSDYMLVHFDCSHQIRMTWKEIAARGFAMTIAVYGERVLVYKKFCPRCKELDEQAKKEEVVRRMEMGLGIQ